MEVAPTVATDGVINLAETFDPIADDKAAGNFVVDVVDEVLSENDRGYVLVTAG